MKKRKREENRSSYLNDIFPFIMHFLSYKSRIERVQETSLTISRFREKYDEKSRPCLILGSRVILRKKDQWSVSEITKHVGSDCTVTVMGIRQPPKRIVKNERARYVKVKTTISSFSSRLEKKKKEKEKEEEEGKYNRDYLFDENVIKYLKDWFVVPKLFRNDDLNALGPTMRPSYRWLLYVLSSMFEITLFSPIQPHFLNPSTE